MADENSDPRDKGDNDGDRTAVIEEAVSASTDASETSDADDPRNHLADVPDGTGCTEIWEHLSEGRDDE